MQLKFIETCLQKCTTKTGPTLTAQSAIVCFVKTKVLKKRRRTQRIQHFTSISCQFSRLKLQIKATKIINGVTVHVLLKEVHIPADARDGSGIGVYLTTIISLVVNYQPVF